MPKRIIDLPVQAPAPALDDVEALDGAANGSRRLNPFWGRGNSLGLPGLISNGSAVPLYIPDSPVYALGADDFGFTLRCTLASLTPAANAVLVDKVAASLGFRLTLLTSGVLRLQFGNGVNLTTFQYDSTVGVQTLAAAAQPIWIDVDCVREGVATFSVNGIQLGNTVSIAGSAAQSLTSTAPLRIFSDGTTHAAAVFHAFYPRNVGLTAVERMRLFLGGPSALPVYRHGTQQAIINPARNSVFSAAATDWSPFAGRASVAVDNVNGEVDVTNISNDGRIDLGTGSISASTRNIGDRFRLGVTVRNKSGSGTSQFNTTILGLIGALTWTANGTYSVIAAASSTNTADFGLLITTPSGESQSLADIRFARLGFLGIYEVTADGERGMVMQDRSLNRLHALRTSNTSSSYSHMGRRAFVPFTITNSSGAAANIQLLGQTAIDTARNWRIASISGRTTAPINLSLGSASGGAQYVNAQAISGNFDIGTFAGRMPGSNANLWAILSADATVTGVVYMEAAD